MRNFENVNCIEELKRQYFALAKKYHSDLTGGSDEKMKEVNAEYDTLFKQYKDIHKGTKEEETVYTAKEATTEVPEDFINIVSVLLHMGLDVELCGRWLWIGGNTKPHKEELKALGCRWSNKKKLWSWHYPEDTCRSRKGGRSMDYIRNVYGSVAFEAGEQLRLGA